MAREIKFSLVYRDMWQSSGKYVPRVDQLVQIAPVIIDMGCFDRVETNGGAFEQVNLLFGENPSRYSDTHAGERPQRPPYESRTQGCEGSHV